jgi:hypothetical protein
VSALGEGCGLIADGQTRGQLTTRGSAVTVRHWMFPVAGSPHGRERSMSSRHRETRLRCVRSGEQGREVEVGIVRRDVFKRS